MNRQNQARFQLRQRESVHRGILRVASALAGAAQETTALTKSQELLPKAVHETRLALKHARALIRLLRPTLGTPVAERLNLRLRTASQRLSEARDTTVALHLLDQLGRKRPAAERAALAHVQARFAKSVTHTAPSPATLTLGLSKAHSVLRATASALEKATWKKRGWSILASGLEAGHRRARKRFRAARKSNAVHDFHAWRTAAKSLLYQLVLIRPIATRRLKAWTASLDDLQAALGHANDLTQLAERIAKNPGQFGEKAAVQRTLQVLERRQAQHRQDILKRGRRVFAERPPEFLHRLARDWKAWRKE